MSWRCRFALYRASRKLDHALNRVERIADACWNGIETQCKDVPIGQCVMSLKGMPAFSADGKNLGEVVEVVRGPDGRVEAVHIQVGRFLGIGDRVVTIDRSAFEELADRVNVRL